MRDSTVCFFLRQLPQPLILLGYKKVRFGAGKYTGIGGGLEPGETITAAMCREIQEEVGIAVDESQLRAHGCVQFFFPAQPTWNQCVHIFTVTDWKGEPHESEEILPTWFARESIPWTQMWDDSRYWLPRVLNGQGVQLVIIFAEDNATVAKIDDTQQ